MTDRVSLIRRAAGNLRKEVQGLRAALLPPPAPGLYTYRLEQESHHGRVHLRIHPDGSGLLSRDVTEAVHLNATAAHVARMALEGISVAASIAALRRRYQGVGDPREEVARIYALVDAFRAPEPRCPRCAFPSLERIPAFSAPVSAPYKVDLALTYRCNNACAHCYNEPGRKAMPSLTTTEWRDALDRLARLGVLHVIFTGGEPTLFPDLIELIRHADHLGPIVGMNTNGRRLAEPGYVRALARAGLSHVQVTLASCRAEEHNAITGTDSFEETVAGIRRALESDLHTITNTT
ncbi:MAG TPA: radical SAM protein, partial [Armatimonadetes bacterium]|nr:radical SAM protein [Armatimonadota bacterium]